MLWMYCLMITMHFLHWLSPAHVGSHLSLWELRALSRLWQRSCLGVSDSWGREPESVTHTHTHTHLYRCMFVYFWMNSWTCIHFFQLHFHTGKEREESHLIIYSSIDCWKTFIRSKGLCVFKYIFWWLYCHLHSTLHIQAPSDVWCVWWLAG